MTSLISWYLSIVIMLVLTGCGLPIPEEVFIIGAGIAASIGELNPFLAFAACIVGAILGDMVMYGAGRYFGRGLMQRGDWFASLLNEHTEERAERMLRLHGLKVFFVARFLVGIRAPMYIAAGILRVPASRFLLFDGISATAVITAVFGISWYYGNQYEEQIRTLIHESQVALTVAAVAVGAVVAVYCTWVVYRRHKAHAVAAALAVAESGGSAAANAQGQPRVGQVANLP
jgi:membrane protein DedA with SNARE-associated domain